MEGNGFLGLNGQLDALLATGKRYWAVGGGLMAVVIWVFTVNQSVKHQTIMEKKQDDISVQGAANTLLLIQVQKYQHDSLVTTADMNALLGQSLATHRMLDNRLRRLEHRPLQEGLGRWEYYPQYGPVPEKYALWFEPRTTSEWLEAKAGGR